MKLDDDPRKDVILQRLYAIAEETQLLLAEMEAAPYVPNRWKNDVGRIDDGVTRLYAKIKKAKWLRKIGRRK